MELNLLRYFYCVAREGGFTKASKVLHVQQPALSRAVRQLEDQLGVTLLERRKRSSIPTKVGQEIFEACARIFQEAENIRALAEAERRECRGVLRFAAASAIAASLVPRVHVTYLRAYPEVWPMSYSGPASVMLERIAAGELEFGLFFYLPKLSVALAATDLAHIPFALVVKAGHERDPRVCSSFIGSREVDDTANKSFPTVDRLRRDHPEVQIRISSNDLAAHKELVLAGLGVSILPRFLVASELAAGSLRALYPNEQFGFPMHLVTRHRQVLSRAARLFLEHLRTALDA
jgi:DNA-binding transcriptional LysR family regulator